ncbi:MAG: class I SAM-dependent methyltransferase [Candidatus Omnitrophica bacterium]|nr:class I SAM-dependent methyltransferase [Candidatus Omnitrophota bacterium]
MQPKPKHFVTPEKTKHHAEILANRVRHRFRHLSRRFKRENIDCFRLYDWDIPEVRAVVDWYAGHVVVAEYERLQTGPDWLPKMAAAVAQALGVPPEKTHTRRRRTNTKEGPRYGKMDFRKERFKVRERDLSFRVNLDDYLDTGLFSDHRDTRVIVRNLAAGKDFLNLYAYTGAFTCAAAAGGAKTTVSVDRSLNYISWAKDNLELNGLWGPQHTLVQSDVNKFLTQAQRERRRFTLAFVDPPSFFFSARGGPASGGKDIRMGAAFDINRDHPQLLQNVLKVMAPGSVVFFSTNHQRFEPRLEGLAVKDLVELTPKTIPEDYRNRRVHRCWQMTAL